MARQAISADGFPCSRPSGRDLMARARPRRAVWSLCTVLGSEPPQPGHELLRLFRGSSPMPKRVVFDRVLVKPAFAGN